MTILCFKTFLLFFTSSIKCFIYSRVKTSQTLHDVIILVTPTKNQIKAISINLIRRKIPFFQVIHYPQEKPDHKQNHFYLYDSQSSKCLLKTHFSLWHVSQSGQLLVCNTSGFFFCLILLVSSPPSTNTLRFLHSLLMNTSP